MKRLKAFANKEGVTCLQLFSPFFLFYMAKKYRFLQFFATGISGFAINLLLVAFFTEMVFGREQYFFGYLIGLSANLIYNFTLHTKITFHTHDHHARRFMLFILYSLAMSAVQASLVAWFVRFVGVDWYLVVITTVVAIGSIVSFLLFKLWIFADRSKAA